LKPPRAGARKIRFAGPARKSGGYRIITYFAGEEVPIFLLALFSKGETISRKLSETNCGTNWLG
jgi:hypothetical protein